MVEAEVVAMSAEQSTPSEPQRDVDELRGSWLSRLMFNQFVGLAPETRTFDQFLDDHAAAFRATRSDGSPWPDSNQETYQCTSYSQESQ